MAVIIKRYRNRKLYNTQSKRYITLEQIEELIKAHEEIKVIDNSTGADMTAATLGQIIYELEKNHSGFLPLTLLTSLVQSGGYRLEEIRQNIFNALNLVHHYDVEIERRVNLLIDRGELSQTEGNKVLKLLLSLNSPQDDIVENMGGRIADFLSQRQIPTKGEVYNLIKKIDTISKRVDELNLDSIKKNI